MSKRNSSTGLRGYYVADDNFYGFSNPFMDSNAFVYCWYDIFLESDNSIGKLWPYLAASWFFLIYRRKTRKAGIAGLLSLVLAGGIGIGILKPFFVCLRPFIAHADIKPLIYGRGVLFLPATASLLLRMLLHGRWHWVKSMVYQLYF